MSEALKELKEHLDLNAKYSHILGLLHWDMETKTPEKGIPDTIETISYFSTEYFKRNTSEGLGELLEKLSAPEEYGQLDPIMQLTVKRMREEYGKYRRIPQDFYTEMTKKQALTTQAWNKAKAAGDFSIIKPYFEEMVPLYRQRMAYTDPDREVFDAMLNDCEEGMDSETLDRLFGEVKTGLQPLVNQILAKPQPDSALFQNIHTIEEQKKVCELLLDYIGFRKEAGAMGEVEHPFTTHFSHNDVRVTNHYYADHLLSPLFTIIHEGGHGILEQNVNPEYARTEAASCRFSGIHESQSRFYENILGRNIHFWEPIYGNVQELMPGLKAISLEQFHREINHVQNSLIRTNADELTYNFHIILRYEIEKMIYRENVPVGELPAIWSDKMEEYLSIRPQNDAEGILQDMHWFAGYTGYFPTYLLGNIYDGMFLEALERDMGSVDSLLADGKILDITRWLNEKIHYYGSSRLPKDTIRQVCGQEVSAAPIVQYFQKKYGKLYKIN